MTGTSDDQLDRARGLMFGLVLGDAWTLGSARDDRLYGGPAWQATAAGQLACFTLEGLIRAWVRGNLKGICHPPSVVWHAYHRWGVLHRVITDSHFAEHHDGPWPDGWLAAAAPLAATRGAAPAMVAALASGRMGTPDEPPNASAGHHALTRTAPVALFAAAPFSSPDDTYDLVVQVAALAHGAQQAWQAAATGVEQLAEALRLGEVRPRRLDRGPAGTAQAALAAAQHAVAPYRRAEQVTEALVSAYHTGGRGAAAYAGAWLGAAHGLRALPLPALELGWVADMLAQDAVRELVEQPEGSDFRGPVDPLWWSRYPGW